nr:hypothetical protein [uncultured Cohaesibacter sp.]
MSDEVQWLVGVVLAIVAMVGGFIVRDRQTAKQIKDGDDRLHDRINRVRDDYVRRDDLQSHMTRLDDNIKEMRQEMKEETSKTNDRLDRLFAEISKK